MLIVLFDEPGLHVFRSILAAEAAIEPIDAQLAIHAAFDESGVPYGVRWVRPNRRGAAMGVEFTDQGEYRLVPIGAPQPKALVALIEAHGPDVEPGEAGSDVAALATRLRGFPDSWESQEEPCADTDVSDRQPPTPEPGRHAEDAAPGTSAPGCLWLGGPPDRSVVTLALCGPDLDPIEVTRRIGLTPTESHRKGDTYGRRNIPYRIGSWMMKVERQAPAGVQECLEELLERLPASEALWSRLATDYEIQLRVGVFFDGVNRDFDISPAVLTAAAKLNGSLWVDIYSF